MNTAQTSRIETRRSLTLKNGERFCWNHRWYEMGIRVGRPMAIGLVPNAPNGQLGTSGHAPPICGTVEVLVS